MAKQFISNKDMQDPQIMLIIIADIKYDQYFAFFIGLYFSVFSYISFISFEYSIKALESLQCFKPARFCLLIKICCFCFKWIHGSVEFVADQIG